jgi:hypothetical protein
MFMDTGLLAHWGLRLIAPSRLGKANVQVGGANVVTRAPGLLHSRSCEVGDDGLSASCRLGQGRAIIVADADFLDAPANSSNLDALMTELAALESR